MDGSSEAKVQNIKIADDFESWLIMPSVFIWSLFSRETRQCRISVKYYSMHYHATLYGMILQKPSSTFFLLPTRVAESTDMTRNR